MKSTTDTGASPFDPLPDVIDAIAHGEMVVVSDDENRENEGDLVCAAEMVTPEKINFMARFGRGLICVALSTDRLKSLDIRPVRKKGRRNSFNTAFMDSVDALDNITTGISAADRAHTIRLLVDDHSGPGDLVSPGHIFPLEAAAGGVLERLGHTEAAVDLSQLAGLRRAGVICEILRDDGEMARLPDLVLFAAEHGLKMTSVADLVRWRKLHEQVLQGV